MRRLPRAALAALVAAAAVVVAPRTAPAQDRADLTPYEGLGSWVDIYDGKSFRDPEGTMAAMADRGVRTLYIETANYHIPAPPASIFDQAAQGRFIDAAHAHGIRVVAWYLPGLTDLKLDETRSLAAIRFRSASGQGFDSFGMDIEATEVADAGARTRRLIRLSSRIRDAVGSGYALAAIIPSPRGMERLPTYWPGFPYRQLAGLYDVFMPMSYWSFRAQGYDEAYRYMARSIQLIREGTGDASVPIHAIGGIADTTGRREDLAFVRVVRETGLLGASLYDFATSNAADWRVMAQIAPNPPQPDPAPLAVGEAFAPYGLIPGHDGSHPREAVFRTGRHRGAWDLDYRAFRIDAGEVTVEVNWRPVATLPAQAGGWSATRSLTLPADVLRDRTNLISFVSSSTEPPWTSWGIRDVSLVPSPLGAQDRTARGNVPGEDTSRGDRVTYRLPATRTILAATVRGFGIARGEVAVALNGRAVGVLAATAPGAWGFPQTLVLPPRLLTGDGTDLLTFDAVGYPPTATTWGVRLVSIAGLTSLPLG